MAQVVQAHVLQLGALFHPSPGGLQGHQPAARRFPDEHPGVAPDSPDAVKNGLDRRRHCHHARPRLAVAQAKLPRVAVHVIPPQGKDLVAPATRQYQQAQCSGGRRGDPALGLPVPQRLAQAPVFVPGEMAGARPQLVLANGPAGIAALGREPPLLGLAVKLRQHLQRAVRHGRAIVKRVVQRHGIPAPHRANGPVAQGRHDVVVDDGPVQVHGLRLAVDRHVRA